MSTEELHIYVAVLFGAVVAGGFMLITVAMRGRTRLRELAIRERIALIEKGLVPSPESDPGRFESLLGTRRALSPKGSRYRSAGVLVMGLGIALVLLLTFAAQSPGIALGVGGGIVVLGLASFVNGMIAGDE